DLIASPDGHCRPFDAAAQGTVFGNGVGVVVLKRLDQAVADGDYIYGVIRGSAVNNDGGRKVGYMAPSQDGQAAVVAEALAMADVNPATIGYIEAHGTATALGDPIEVYALAQGLNDAQLPAQSCAIGSVKSNVGHLQIASGVVGFMKAILSVQHGQIPPTLHYQTPNPKIDFVHTPFYVNTQLLDWPHDATPRRAGVNSLGIGGANAHMIVEEPPIVAPRRPAVDRPWHLLTLSARTPQALHDLAARYEQYLATHADPPLGDLVFTANTGRVTQRERATFRFRSADELATLLRDLSTGQSDERVQVGRAANVAPDVVVVCAAQRCLSGRAARELYDTSPTFRLLLDRCIAAVPPDRTALVTATLFAEPIPNAKTEDSLAERLGVFALNYALVELYRSWGVKLATITGRGVGQIAAACSASQYPLSAAIGLVIDNTPVAEAAAIADSAARIDLESYRGADSAWIALLDTLARLQIHGVTIDWLAFDADYARRRLPLPTYPFQRQRYWIERPRTLPASGDRAASSAPTLLGTRLRSPALSSTVFAANWSLAALPYLAEHRLNGRCIAPGSLSLAWLIEAGRSLSSTAARSVVIDDLHWERIVPIDEHAPSSMQLIVEPAQTEGPRGFEIVRLVDDATTTRHVRGRITSANTNPQPAWLAAATQIANLQQAAQATVGRDEFYRRLDRHDVQLGARYRNVDHVWVGETITLAKLEFAESIGSDHSAVLHPLVIDALLQVAVGSSADQSVTRVPAGMERFTLVTPADATTLWCAVRQATSPADDGAPLTVDAVLFTPTGEVVAWCEGLRYEVVAGRATNTPQAVETSQSSRATWLLLDDGTDIGTALANQLRDRGGECVSITLGDVTAKLGPNWYQLTGRRAAEFERVLREVTSTNSNLAGIINLWSLLPDGVTDRAAANHDGNGKSGANSTSSPLEATKQFQQACEPILNGTPVRRWLVNRSPLGVIDTSGWQAVSLDTTGRASAAAIADLIVNACTGEPTPAKSPSPAALRPTTTTTAAKSSPSAPLTGFPLVYSQASAHDRSRLLTEFVRREVTQSLGVKESDSLPLDRGFAELGLDSLTSVELRNRLQKQLACRLPATTLFDYPTIQQLVGLLAKVLDAAVESAASTPSAATVTHAEAPPVAPSVPAPQTPPRTETRSTPPVAPTVGLPTPARISSMPQSPNPATSAERRVPNEPRPEPLAIIGMACRFPGGANDLDAYWKMLAEGRDATSEVPRERFDIDAFYDPDRSKPGKTATRRGGFLDDIHHFDAQFFGIAPREA
ncbi:MAG: polyketide synthase dehydratase domain-containing protein, partial [Planctomycetaceae bacterium]|nr:polyketide synthase dehydratase domain-containing protein [Planctomycetaceae bacterium]